VSGCATGIAGKGASRFACTSCGNCCDRSPEVQLSEAAGLADVFVFRLMFRLYSLPRQFGDYPGEKEIFYQKKRLLAAHAARQSTAKRLRGGRAIEHKQYLVLSALTLQEKAGACGALRSGLCTIYDRRPLACRTVPFHYSRVEAAAASDLQAFVSRPGHGCDTGGGAPIVLEEGRLVDPALMGARAEALERAGKERPWTDAILSRMVPGRRADPALPSLEQIQADAAYGATTVSMRIAWRIAADCGLIEGDELDRLAAAQLASIGRALRSPACTAEARATLCDMRADYLANPPA
jgi:Fe-S-cluster containining protein